MSLDSISSAAEELALNYPYCNGGIFLDAVGRTRPDFIGGNCFEHAHKLAAAVGMGEAISTPLTYQRIHAAYVVELDGAKYFFDTSMNLSVPFKVGENAETALPFDSRYTPASFKAIVLSPDQMEFVVRQPFHPHGRINKYMVDFSNGCTEYFMHRVLRAGKRNIQLISQDDEGMVQLSIALDGSELISGRESTEYGPGMRKPGKAGPLIDRMAKSLGVQSGDVVYALEACAHAYREWHGLH